MSSDSLAKYRFDDVFVDESLNLIIRKGYKQRVEPKHLAVLSVLVKERRVFTRGEIIARVWEGLAGGDESLSRAIFSLRNALGDDAKQPRYIETVPRRGYRFIGQVVNESMEDAVAEYVSDKKDSDTKLVEKPRINPVDKTKGRFKFVLAKGGVLASLCLALLACFWLFVTNGLSLNWQGTQQAIVPVAITITKKKGAEGDMDVSSDGERMLYVHYFRGEQDLYYRSLVNNTESRLTADAWFERSPTWLDEDTFLYIRCKNKKCQLIRQQLGADAEVMYQSESRLYDIVYNESAALRVLVNEFVHPGNVRVLAFDPLTQKIKPASTVFGLLPAQVYSPSYSKDGKRLFFYTIRAEQPQLKYLDLSAGELVSMPFSFDRINGLSSSSNMQHVYVSGRIGPVKGIWRLSIDDASLKLLAHSNNEEEYGAVNYVDEQATVYFAGLGVDEDIGVMSLQSGQLDLLSGLNSSVSDIKGVFNQDGTMLYFVSSRSGDSEIWRYDVESKTSIKITHLKAKEINAFALSQDASHIALSYLADEPRLGLIETKSGRLQHSKSVPYDVFPLAWEFNNERFFVSEHRGQVNLYRYDTASLNATLVSQNSGLYVESTVGSSVFFVDYEHQALVSIDENNTKTVVSPSIPGLPKLMPGNFAIIGGGKVLSATHSGPKLSVSEFVLGEPIETAKSGESAPWTVNEFELDPEHRIVSVSDISADGQLALITLSTRQSGGIRKLTVVDP